MTNQERTDAIAAAALAIHNGWAMKMAARVEFFDGIRFRVVYADGGVKMDDNCNEMCRREIQRLVAVK